METNFALLAFLCFLGMLVSFSWVLSTFYRVWTRTGSEQSPWVFQMALAATAFCACVYGLAAIYKLDPAVVRNMLNFCG